MAQKPIREHSAKNIISRNWNQYFPGFHYSFRSALLTKETDIQRHIEENPWLKTEKLVVKPDMLFGKRGLNQLVYLKDQKPGDVTLEKAMSWIQDKKQKKTALKCGSVGVLDTFIIEPFCSFNGSPEYYLSFAVEPEQDVIHFSTEGGVHIEDNWDKVSTLKLSPAASSKEIQSAISNTLTQGNTDLESISQLIFGFYRLFKDLHFSYLEFNPFILENNTVHLLDTVARIDDTAGFLMKSEWGPIDFPPAFGERQQTEIENEIQKIDQNSGASLKLTLLNPEGLIWTLVAGGGASVVYADTIANIWGANEIANYGEYSGNPTKSETHLYAKGVLKLMTERPDPNGRGKVLIIGGSIANFTDVAKTFDGIIQAFEEMHEEMKKVKTRIFVRRGGPNYEIGLQNIQTAADRLGLPIEVYGPETHLTDIVQKAKLTQTEGVIQ